MSTEETEINHLMRDPTSSYGTSDELPFITERINFYGMCIRWLIYNKIFCKSCTHSDGKLAKFLDGLFFSPEVLWPLVFSGLIINDLILYSKHNDLYDDSLGKLLVGLSSDPSMLSSNHGNFVTHSFSYWALPGFFLVTPIITGFIWMSLGSPSVRRKAFKNDPRAINDLNQLRNSNSFFRSLYADYRLWSIGYPQRSLSNVAIQLLYLLFNLSIYALDARIIEQFAARIYYFFKFRGRKNACEKQQKVYTFLQQLGEYDCTICGDWPFVYFQDVFSSQGCLNGLTAQLQTFDVLFSGIKRVTPFRDFQSLDFSQQSWSEWNGDQWQLILNQIELGSQNLALLNLSLPAGRQKTLDTIKPDYLGKFLNKVPVLALDLMNTWNGTILSQYILPAVKFSGLTYLDVSGCQIEDDTYVNITTNLPKSLSILKASHNFITDPGSNLGLYQLRDSAITLLDISYNQLEGLIFPSAKSSVPAQLTTIDYSGNDFSQGDLTSFWQLTCDNSSITNVFLENVNLNDGQIMSLNDYTDPTSIKYFSFANNQITNYGFGSFCVGLVDSQITGVDFSANPYINDDGLDYAGPYLANCALTVLKLAGISITKQGLTSFLPNLLNTTVETFSLADNSIDNDSAEPIMEWLDHPSNPVRNLDLSKNALTNVTGEVVKGNLYSLILSENNLSNQSVIDIAENLADSGLTMLGLNNIGLQLSGALALGTALPKSSLKTLDVGNNFIGDEGALAIAKNLIDTNSAIKSLADQKIALSFIRWLAKEATPNTNLKVVNFENNELSVIGARAFCRVIPGSKILFADFKLAPNFDVNAEQLNLYSCRFNQINFPSNTPLQSQKRLASVSDQSGNITSSALIALSTMGIILLIILGLITLYLLYRVTKPKINSCFSNTHGFFGKNAPDKKQELLTNQNVESEELARRLNFNYK